MLTKSVIVTLILLAMVNRSLSLTCNCYDHECGPSPNCTYGVTKSPCSCGCYDACAKGPGEKCGGTWGFSGTCSEEFKCNEPSFGEGVCVRRLQSDILARCIRSYYWDYNGKNCEAPDCSFEDVIAKGVCTDFNLNPNLANICKMSCVLCGGTSMAFKAIQNGDLELLNTLLENGTDPQGPTGLSHEESTLLLYAVSRESIEMINILLNHGADINKHIYGFTPLRNAIKRKDFKIIKHLVEHKADVNEINIYQDQTVLIYGVETGNKDIVNLLIENGADVNNITKNGKTALIIAASNNYTDIVTTLLENGANHNIESRYGDTALIIAASNNYSHILTTLLENGANPNIEHYGKTALIVAASNNYSDIVTTLLENGAKPNTETRFGETALNKAVQEDYSDIVKILLNFGADPNMKYGYGNNGLGYAALYNYSDIVTILLENGANPNIKNRIGDTALIIAANYNYSDIVTTLLENGANPNITNCRGNTALIKAASNNYSDIMTKLLENGANPNTIKVDVCGGEYNSSSGTIHYTLYGCDYQRYEHCIWIIRAEDPIKITFVTFDIENGLDHLYVLDGESLASNVLGNFTGSNIPSPLEVETSTNAVYLHFILDGGIKITGFELTWELIEMQPPTTEPPTTQLPNTEPPATQPPTTESPTTQPPGCGGEFNSNIGTIRYPLNGGYYNNNEDCIWIIRATNPIEITFSTFNTETCCDTLFIRDGETSKSAVLGILSGDSIPSTVVTSTHAAYLYFTSDYGINNTGFVLHWESLGIVSPGLLWHLSSSEG